MSWQKPPVRIQKMMFIKEWLQQEYTMSALCARYKISRQCGYELVNRFKLEGTEAFEERSRRHHSHPYQTSAEQIKIILDSKHRYPSWGPVKIKDFLEQNKLAMHWPATSTIGEILKQHGLVNPKVAKRRTPAHSEPLKHCQAPNQVWSADYKGQFRLGNQRYCYPLTMTDNYSRYILCCDGFESISGKTAIKSFEKVFCDYGLPDVIRTDNGPPFASTGLGGLTRLSIWFLKLGIMPERIEPGCPEQNGRHERMHRTLKEGIKINLKYSLKKQQSWFDHFRKEFNNERPHQALKSKTPAAIHTHSTRSFPQVIPEITYPDSFMVRQVKTNGTIKYQGKCYYVSELLHGEPMGLQLIDDERAIVYFSRLKLGIVDVRLEKIIRP